MKIKHLLTLLLTMATLPALAQGSGIKGKVVSRGDRAAIEQVKITLTPGERQATSDAEGRFRFDNVASGDYTLTFEADDYEPLEIKVRVDKLTKDVRSIALVPVYTEAFDDSIFAEFDTETANDTQSLPSSLSSSKDVFNNIASYKFGEMRFNLRGYDSQYTNVYFNGIRLAGKVRVVDSFPDLRVQVVSAFPDLRVQTVDYFPDDIGQWQFVDYGEDFTVQFVDSFPDIRIQFINSFPGVP